MMPTLIKHIKKFSVVCAQSQSRHQLRKAILDRKKNFKASGSGGRNQPEVHRNFKNICPIFIQRRNRTYFEL